MSAKPHYLATILHHCLLPYIPDTAAAGIHGHEQEQSQHAGSTANMKRPTSKQLLSQSQLCMNPHTLRLTGMNFRTGLGTVTNIAAKLDAVNLH